MTIGKTCAETGLLARDGYDLVKSGVMPTPRSIGTYNIDNVEAPPSLEPPAKPEQVTADVEAPSVAIAEPEAASPGNPVYDPFSAAALTADQANLTSGASTFVGPSTTTSLSPVKGGPDYLAWLDRLKQRFHGRRAASGDRLNQPASRSWRTRAGGSPTSVCVRAPVRTMSTKSCRLR